jgi:hypothetical protein
MATHHDQDDRTAVMRDTAMIEPGVAHGDARAHGTELVVVATMRREGNAD